MGHLTGTRVSALLDGQLPATETDQAWAHVHACHHCRDRVEREGWVKARLARLSGDDGPAPDHLRGTLHHLTPGERFVTDPRASARDLAGRPGGRHGRRASAAAVVGSGAAGAAMLGVLALGIAPASAPGPADRGPTGRTTQPVSTTTPVPFRVPLVVAVTGATVSTGATVGTGTPSPRGSASPTAAPTP